jgi:hypothetical protein
VALTAVAVVALVLTALNAWWLWSFSSQRNELQARIERDRTEAARLRTEASAIERSVDRAALGALADSAREANDLIDRRTFSWTAFFAVIEKALPIDVRIVTVAPRIEKGRFTVGMTIVARDLADVSQFMETLQQTGVFYDIVPADQQLRDDGTYGALINAAYVPPASRTHPPAITTPAPAPAPPAPAPARRPQ